MAYDSDHADTMRKDLGLEDGLSEKKMFGGLCFLLHGNMVCGVHAGGAMFRVGKAAESDALALEGVEPLSFTGRKMGGMVELNGENFELEATRLRLVEMSLANAASFPPKGIA